MVHRRVFFVDRKKFLARPCFTVLGEDSNTPLYNLSRILRSSKRIKVKCDTTLEKKTFSVKEYTLSA